MPPNPIPEKQPCSQVSKETKKKDSILAKLELKARMGQKLTDSRLRMEILTRDANKLSWSQDRAMTRMRLAMTTRMNRYGLGFRFGFRVGHVWAQALGFWFLVEGRRFRVRGQDFAERPKLTINLKPV